MLKKIFFWTALTWSGIILVSCLIKSDEIPQIGMDIPNLDKVVHAFMHFVFTLLWFFYFKKKIGNLKNYKLLLISLVLSFFFGIAIELMQRFFTVTRNADVYDVFANLSGATLAVMVIILVNKYNGIIDKI
ncbi:MAG: VanZ family protein [Lentimicrobium sp.]|nr:VanZ family protein [Lentimicrobium sp.]